MLSWFSFNRQRSDSFGLHVERVPSQNRPARKYDRYNVPGRNGDIFVMQDAWENVEQTYEVWGGNGSINNATSVGYDLSGWLFSRNNDSGTGYEKLFDSYDPEHFRWAVFTGPFDFESVLTRRGRTEVTFSCDPRKFLTASAENPVLIGNFPYSITNPTRYTSKPHFTIYGSGAATLSCSGKTITISDIVDGMFLDCENMRAYDEYGANLNTLISGEFPIIEPGEQSITKTGGITGVDLVPMWWEL